MSRIIEGEIADLVIELLEGRLNHEATIQELIAAIPQMVKLSAEDLAPSLTRKNEAIWEQQVRNITSHKAAAGNAIHEGYLVSVRGGLRLGPKRRVKKAA